MVFVTLQSPVCLKPFVKAVNTLSKIGDEVFVEITEDAMYLQSANSSTTAIAYFRFDRGFFSEFDSRIATVTRTQAANSIGYAVKLSSKCLSNCLKMVAISMTGVGSSSGPNVTSDDPNSTSKSSHLAVRYDTVSFECVHPSSTASSQDSQNCPDEDLTIRLSSSNPDFGRAKTTTFKLRPLDTSEMMAADFAATTMRSSTHHLSAPAKKFSDLVANFATSDRNLLFCLNENSFSLAADPLGKSGKWHRIGTDHVGPASVFTKYDIGPEEANFGCILAELKTFLAYAVSLDWSPMIHIDFSEAGRPIVFSVEVADRLGFGDGTTPITMGSLVLSTMTLPPGMSAAAAKAAPMRTPKEKPRDRNQPQIDTVLKSTFANRANRRTESNNEPIDLELLPPSPTVRSSLESRGSVPKSPCVRSRRASVVSFADTTANSRTTPSPVSFLFTELFNGTESSSRDPLMVSPSDILAGDSDPEH